MLCGDDASSAAICNALRAAFGDPVVVVERREARSIFIRRRIEKLGAVTVLGQLLFMALAAPILRRRASGRAAQILADAGLNTTWPEKTRRYDVSSVNDAETSALIASIKPALVVVNGTRIIARRVIEQCACPMINIHCGLTPKYRGVHGGYWALAQDDRAMCGVTIHLVSPGVDTGDILAQRTIEPTSADNFATYPHLQLAAAMIDFPRIASVAEPGQYGAVALAVGHAEFAKMGAENIRALGKPGAVLYDIRGLLPKNMSDGRL